jgi:hypothetical protein
MLFPETPEPRAAQQVKMQMRNRLPAVFPDIRNDAPAVVKTVFRGEPFGGKQKLPREGGVPVVKRLSAAYVPLRNYQQVKGRLRGDILESDDFPVFVYLFGRDFPVRDFAK